VKPFQTVMFPIWAGGMPQMFDPWEAGQRGGRWFVEAKTAITRIGRNRNAYNTTAAHAVNACLAVSRRLRTELLLFGGEQDVHDDEHRPAPPSARSTGPSRTAGSGPG